MRLPKHRIHYIEFYITNVCNLNCDNCRSFNNFPLKGHQKWEDYEHIYQEWSKILDINMFAILGGEPMLNPDFLLWVKGLADLWPESTVVINTNGTQLDRWPDLYNLLVEYKGRISVSIDRHDLQQKDFLDQKIRNILVPPLEFLDNNFPTHFRGEPLKNFYQHLKEIYTKLKSINVAWPDFQSQDYRKWPLWPLNIRNECLEEYLQNLDFWKFKSWKDGYTEIKDPSWPDCPTPDDFESLPESIKTECRDMHDFDPEIWSNYEWRHQYESIRQPGWPSCKSKKDFYGLPDHIQKICINEYSFSPEFYKETFFVYKDANDIKVKVTYSKSFTNNILSPVPGHDNKWTFHDSDPKKAIEVCGFCQCHHFSHGQMHKCAPLASIKDFVTQFDVELSSKQKSLIDNYIGAQHTDSWDYIEQFLDNLKTMKMIPQCALCPETNHTHKFTAKNKKQSILMKLIR